MRTAALSLFFALLCGAFAAPSAFGQAKTDELLGFSRYLPADTSSYVSMMQLGHYREQIAGSKAWAKIEEVPEIAKLLEQNRTQLASNEIPPPVKTAIELAKAAGSSEISLATSTDASQDLLNIARVGMLSVAVMAPSPLQPDSEEGKRLEAKRVPLRAEWATTVPKLRLPSFVLAARVKDAAKYQIFVDMMVDMGWQEALKQLRRDMAPELLPPWEKAYSHVKVGEVPLIRFRLKLGDLLRPGELDRPLGMLPMTDAERTLALQAINNLSVDAHLGFVGEYLTLAVGADDRLINQIVERFEGRSKDTLAASAGFARIRADLKPESIAILYGEHTETQREIRRTFLPLLNTLADPDLHGLLGAPPEVTLMVHRVQYRLEATILSTPLRQESVLNVEHGLKQTMRSEFDREPAVPSATPLRTLSLVPENAIAYSIHRQGSAESLFQEIRYMIEQQRLQFRTLGRQFGENGELPEFVRKQEALMDGVLKPIDEKLDPALRGEMGLILGAFTKFGVNEGAPFAVRDLPVPTLAAVVHTATADRAIEGFKELYDFLMSEYKKQERRPDPKGDPVRFAKQDLDGIETWVLSSPHLDVTGIEPHFARLGNALVFSTSFELTKKMRDASTGKTPGIAASPAHQAMEDLLPVGAGQASFLDGGAFSRNLRSMSDGVFALIEKNREEMRMSDRDVEQMALVKRSVGVGLVLLECLKGSASSVVGEGRVDQLREWIKVEDLKQ